MEISSKDIIFFVLNIMANIFSTYLFYLNIITLDILIFIFIGSVTFIVITSFQLKMNKFVDEFDKIKVSQKKFDERLKMHKQLINIEARLIALEKEK